MVSHLEHKSGKNAPMRLRSDFRAAVSLKHRLHRESSEEIAGPMFPAQYRRWHSSSRTHPIPEGILRPSFISQRQTDGPPNIWDTSGISGNVFAHPETSSSAPYPQELNSTWRKTIEEPIHMSIAEKSGRPKQDSDLRCQSGPSAKKSVILSRGDFPKNYGADQQRLQFPDLHFDKFTTPATFACWKIRFKTEVCTCSQFPTEAMQWIKEVELVDSVDYLKSSSSTRTKSSIILTSKEESVWRNKRPRSRTVSFAEDRLLT